MAHRQLFFAFLLLIPACGGRETGDSPNGTGTGGGGGSVTGGTGGSSGTVSTTGAGGASTAGQSGGVGGHSGGVDWTVCSANTCVLEAVGACGPGCEPVAISAFTAIEKSFVDEYNQAHPPAPCVAIGCPPVQPGEANIPNYYAACIAGHCQPVDVRFSPLSACNVDSDCYLRSGTTCCGCGNGNLIAVSKSANVEQAFCGGSACAADCASAPIPPGVVAICPAGQCVVQYPTPGYQ